MRFVRLRLWSPGPLALWLVFALVTAAIAQTPPARPAARPAPARPVAAAPSYKDLKFPPMAALQIPKAETYTLPNGMKLFLLENHELPVIDGIAMVRTGNLFDPRDKIGLAMLTGMVMRTGGTILKTGDELNAELESVAAGVESEIGESSGAVRFSSLRANTDQVLAIFKDILTSPAFRQDKLDLAKNQLHNLIARRNDNVDLIAPRELASLLYGRDDSYGWQIEHTPIDRIHRGDLQAFYRRYFFPSNILLGITGDFDAADMKDKMEKLFAGWTVKQQPVPAFPKLGRPAAAGEIDLATRQDLMQTLFTIGTLGSEYRDKDYPALVIMAHILGGGPQSRLIERLHSLMPSGAGVSANWGAGYDHAGVFSITGSTKPLSTAETIRAIQNEIERIRTTEVTDAELKAAKDSLLNGLAFVVDNQVKILNQILACEYFGYPADFIRQYQAGLAAVTRADVLNAAKEHLDPRDIVAVVVGNPLEFGISLDRLGMKVAPIDLTIPPSEPGAAAADTASLEKGKQMLMRAQQAVGGADKLASVKDFMQVGQHTSAGSPDTTETVRWIAPTYIREDGERPGFRFALYTDGKTGWISSPQGWVGLSAPMLQVMQADTFRIYSPLLLSDRTEGRTVNALDEETVEISDRSGKLVQMVLDPQTGLPAKLLYRVISPNSGATTVAEDDLADFRDVAGIKFPHQITEFRNGQKSGGITITEIKLNSGLKVQDLSKRP